MKRKGNGLTITELHRRYFRFLLYVKHTALLANLIPNTSFRYKRKAEKLFFKKIALGARLLFWHEETGGTAPYISLKIPGSFSRLIFQRSSEWLHMEVHCGTKTCQ